MSASASDNQAIQSLPSLLAAQQTTFRTEGPVSAATRKDRLQRVIDMLVKEQPIMRAIHPSEQAKVVAWLCSDDAAMVTGHVLPVDGGWTAKC